jgi:hypothetical protein
MKTMYKLNFPEGKVISEADYLIHGLGAVTPSRMSTLVKQKYKANTW